MSNPLYKVITPGGHKLTEVVSAFQKMIRRGQMDDAIYFAVDMWKAGYPDWCWSRMRIIVSEDIGPAEPLLPAVIEALHKAYLDMKAKKSAHVPERLPYIHAVMLLSMAKKSRIVDHALTVHFTEHDKQKRPIPDFALDCHTAAGKAMGRWNDHFYDVAALLNNKSEMPNPYEAAARVIDDSSPKPANCQDATARSSVEFDEPAEPSLFDPSKR